MPPDLVNRNLLTYLPPVMGSPPKTSAAPAQRAVPRVFLERVSRALLVRLALPHAPLLEAHGLSLAALAASPQTDRTHVDALWRLLGAAPPELAEIRDDLIAVADVGSAAGHEILLTRDHDKRIDPDLGAEDAAALARLDFPALFEIARPQVAGQAQARRFASFRPRKPLPHPEDGECRAAFEKRMSEELVSRGRSDYFRRHDSRIGGERHMDLVYGRLASARDLLGKSGGAGHEVTAQVTNRTTERAHAIFHDDTCRLDVAGHDWMKELVRRVYGETHFGSAAHFEGGETFTLAPLANLEAALSAEGVSGLKKVELQQLEVEVGGENGAWVAVGARSNCLKSAAGAYALRALDDGAACMATFHLFFAGRPRALTVKLALPGSLELDRRDPQKVQLVREWLLLRGFMQLPDQLRDAEAPELSEVGTS